MPDYPYVSNTDLAYYHNRIKTVFADKTELQALDDKVDEIISEGGEPNTIETVKVNGTALTPDAQKAVDVTVPTKTSDLTNDGSDASASPADPFATQSYVAANGGKIDSISVNGTAQTIDSNKNVDLAVPVVEATNTSSAKVITVSSGAAGSVNDRLEVLDTTFNPPGASSPYIGIEVKAYDDNQQMFDRIVPGVAGMTGYVADKLANNGNAYQTASDVSGSITTALANSGDAYQTASDVQTAISTAVSSAYKYKGSVATVDALPSTGQTEGDVYDVQATGMNYAWNGSAWDALGTYVDTSTLWGKSELRAMTTAEIDALFE